MEKEIEATNMEKKGIDEVRVIDSLTIQRGTEPPIVDTLKVSTLDGQEVDGCITTCVEEDDIPEGPDTEGPDTEGLDEEESELTGDDAELKDIQSIVANSKEFVAVSKYIGVKNKINELHAVTNRIKEKVGAMCPDEKFSLLKSRITEVDVKELAKLDMSKDEDWKKVEVFYQIEGEDGKFEFAIEFHDEKNKREFYRDFLVYIQESEIQYNNIDIAIAKYENDVAKIYEEHADVFTKVSTEFKSISEFYYNYMKSMMGREDITDLQKTKIGKVLAYRQQGISLNFLIKEIKDLIDTKGTTKSIKHGYNTSFIDMASKVDRILKSRFSKYRLNLNLPAFVDLEEREFTEYAKYNNLFMFILMRYIKHNYEKFTCFDIITITEIIVHMGYFRYEETDQPDTVQEFKESVRTVLSLVVNN